MYHQRICTERGAVAVEWAAITSLGYAAIVEIVGVVTRVAGGEAFHVDAEWR